MKDSNEREYAKLSQLKAGDYIEIDDGFDCRKQNIVTIREAYGKLGFECSHGIHWLSGQLADDGDSLIGIYSEWEGEK